MEAPTCLKKCDSDPDWQCTVGKILIRYQEVGIPFWQSQHIQKEARKMYDLYKGGQKKMDRGKFEETYVKTLFKAYHNNSENMIKENTLLTEKMKKENIEFLNDQLTERKYKYLYGQSGLDRLPQQEVQKANKKYERL